MDIFVIYLTMETCLRVSMEETEKRREEIVKNIKVFWPDASSLWYAKRKENVSYAVHHVQRHR